MPGGMATHIINDLTSILPGARVGWWYQLAREMRPSRTMTAVVASEESWFSRWNVEYIAAAWCCCDVVRRSALTVHDGGVEVDLVVEAGERPWETFDLAEVSANGDPKNSPGTVLSSRGNVAKQS